MTKSLNKRICIETSTKDKKNIYITTCLGAASFFITAINNSSISGIQWQDRMKALNVKLSAPGK